MDISVVIPTFNEEKNISLLLNKIKEILSRLSCQYEIIVVDAGSDDDTVSVAKKGGADVLIQKSPGYGGALKEAFSLAKGKYLITLDADLSHNPYVIKRLYALRDSAHILIASRYVSGGVARMPVSRYLLSRILNGFFSFGLRLPIKDLSSGFRLYRSSIFKEIDFSERDFSSLTEIVIKAYMNGFQVKEIPFHYSPRAHGKSHAKIIRFGIGFLRTFIRMWRLRNTIYSADYDDRAFDSRILLQRYWQRKRYEIITDFAGHPASLLDAGCGSSRILGAFPQAVGLDIQFKKLRYNLSLGNALVKADLRKTCFKDESFDVIVCSEVVEHIRGHDEALRELGRVLKESGVLIIGTPDYSRLTWRFIEWLYKRIVPGGYADEHINRFSRRELIEALKERGFKLMDYKYIMGSELICKFIKQNNKFT